MKTKHPKIICAGHVGNFNSQKNGFQAFESTSDTGGELSLLPKFDTTFQSPPVYHKKTPTMCKYYDKICPDNIPKYLMKCLFGKEECKIRRFFNRWEKKI